MNIQINTQQHNQDQVAQKHTAIQPTCTGQTEKGDWIGCKQVVLLQTYATCWERNLLTIQFWLDSSKIKLSAHQSFVDCGWRTLEMTCTSSSYVMSLMEGISLAASTTCKKQELSEVVDDKKKTVKFMRPHRPSPALPLSIIKNSLTAFQKNWLKRTKIPAEMIKPRIYFNFIFQKPRTRSYGYFIAWGHVYRTWRPRIKPC